jgi:hypothetical protein
MIKHEIPSGWRICGENLYAVHSIRYEKLKCWFQIFSIWNERNEALSWADTVQYADMLELMPVPVLYTGIYNEKQIRGLWTPEKSAKSEGYVIRLADPFRYEDFKQSIAKYVREKHVQTDEHWMHKPVEENGL